MTKMKYPICDYHVRHLHCDVVFAEVKRKGANGISQSLHLGQICFSALFFSHQLQLIFSNNNLNILFNNYSLVVVYNRG